MDWLDLLAAQGTLKSLLQHHSLKASILRCSAFFMVQLSCPYMTTRKTIALTRWTFIFLVKQRALPSVWTGSWGIRQDGACSFYPEPMCPARLQDPQVLRHLLQPLLTGSPSRSQVSCPAPSPGQPPLGTPSVSSQHPSGPLQPLVLPTHRLQLPRSSPSLSSGSLCCRHTSLLTAPGPRQVHCPLRQPKGRPSDRCPHQRQQCQGPERVPSPFKGRAGGAGPHPRLTSRATCPSTVLLRLSGSPEACPGSHTLTHKGPGAMAVQEDTWVLQGTSCQPRPLDTRWA